MKNVIIGTAGHIDHGKTALIKALTGRDTDKLKEEKERGISIDLGFTWFSLPSGKQAGIVDVPGHEKFIKNMLAGATGIDVVMLVIAADEGVMPQTREHLNILKLLNKEKGVIVLTKKDLVDDEWLEMIVTQIKEEFEDTFLKNSNIIAVSSKTGEGMNSLIREIDTLADDVAEKKASGAFCMPIDRVFTVPGFGTVATGTLLSGSAVEGDIVEILPQKLEARIRSIQVHEKSVKEALAGQRAALNLPNIRLNQLQRGNVLSAPDVLEPATLIDVKIELLKDTKIEIRNRDRARLYQGTSEVMCRIVLLDKEILKPGDSGFAQLILEKPIACRNNDRFIIRTYSPMYTIAGGSILDSNPTKRKRFKEAVIKELRTKEIGDYKDIIEQHILKHSPDIPEINEIKKIIGNIGDEEFLNLIEQLKSNESIYELKALNSQYLLHISYISDLGRRISEILKNFHKLNSLKEGISKEELKTKLSVKNKHKLWDEIFSLYVKQGLIKQREQYIALKDFKISFSEEEKKYKDFLLEKYNANKFATPKLGEILKENTNKQKLLKRIFDVLLDSGDLIRIDEDLMLTKAAVKEAEEKLKEYLEKNNEISAAQFRDLLGTSRKYAISILEYFDDKKITKRAGDVRSLY